nr:hypothetical protein [Ruminococcus sp. zg-924]
MDLRPEGYYVLRDIVFLSKKLIKSFQIATDICINIVSAFHCLHNMGLVYHNISDDCIFVNPINGDVKITGVDNVTVDGVNTEIMGNPRFLAPEIVMGKTYNTQAGRYSISVLVFLIILANHPLEGRKWIDTTVITNSIQKELYGTNPVFIFDTQDSSNRPSNRLQKQTIEIWNCLPEYLKRIFINAFSKEVLMTPSKRIKEMYWLEALTRFRSDIVKCSCGNEIFLKNSGTTSCDKCGNNYEVNHYIELPYYTIPATQGTRLYRCQLEWCQDREALKPVGQIVRKKDDLDFIGYRNMLDDDIVIISSNEESYMLAPKKVFPINEPFEISLFGTSIRLR